jgi:hypothetical protein
MPIASTTAPTAAAMRRGLLIADTDRVERYLQLPTSVWCAL